MSFEIIKGNLLVAFANDQINVLGHCCNMQHLMGAGIAKQIKQNYPEAYIADGKWFTARYEQRDFQSLSIATFRTTKRNRKYVVNLYGQKEVGTFKRQLNYGLLVKALNQLASITDADDVIGFPYGMGCGLAGGDWTIVQEIIESIFDNHQVKIYQL